MTQKRDDLITGDKEKQYLQETQEYIKGLKDNLIRKILALQQNKKTETNLVGENTLENSYTGN
jgi:hypothetical protein